MKVPTEYQECTTLAAWLDYHRVLYTHVPLGGKRDKREAMNLKRIGAKAGVPDYLIFTPPPNLVLAEDQTGPEPFFVRPRGIALEMKRQSGGRVEPRQRRWMANLERVGWVCLVARGAADAIDQLQALGYGRSA